MVCIVAGIQPVSQREVQTAASSTARRKSRDVRYAGRRAANSPVLRFLARAGLTARGVMYVVIGWIAVQIAFGHSRRQADRTGALHVLGGNSFGEIALWLLVVGFIGLALWRLAEAIYGAPGHDDKATARITVGCSGLALGAAVEMDCVAFRPTSAPPLPWAGHRVRRADGSGLSAGSGRMAVEFQAEHSVQAGPGLKPPGRTAGGRTGASDRAARLRAVCAGRAAPLGPARGQRCRPPRWARQGRRPSAQKGSLSAGNAAKIG